MYNYIFATIYKWAIGKDKGKWLSKQHACNGVTFALITHLGLLFEFFKKGSGIRFNKFASIEKNSIVIAIVLLFLAVRLFYTKIRINRIESKYIDTGKIGKNGGWFVFAVIFIPLFILIIIGWRR